MITFLVSNWRLIIAGVLIAALGIQSIRLDDAQVDIAQMKADANLAIAQRQLAARQFQTAISTQRAAHAVQQQENVDAYNKVVKERDTARADLAAGHNGLRDQLSAYLTGNSPGAGTGAAASGCGSDQARTVGNVLLTGDDLAQQLAEAAEQRNDEVRLLLRQIAIDRAACAPVQIPQ